MKTQKCCLCGKTETIALYTRRGPICIKCLDHYHAQGSWPFRPEPIIFGRNEKPASPYAFTTEGVPMDLGFYLQNVLVKGATERCAYCLTVDAVVKRDPITGQAICPECAKNDPSVKLRPLYNPDKNKKSNKREDKQHGCKPSEKRMAVEEALLAGIFSAAEIVEYAECAPNYVYQVAATMRKNGLNPKYITNNPDHLPLMSIPENVEKMRQGRWKEKAVDVPQGVIDDILAGGQTAQQIASKHRVKPRLVYKVNAKLEREGKGPQLIKTTRQERMTTVNAKRYGYDVEELKKSKAIIRQTLLEGGKTLDQIQTLAKCKRCMIDNEIHRMKQEGLKPLFLKKEGVMKPSKQHRFFSTATQKVIDCLANQSGHGMNSGAISTLTGLKSPYVDNIISDLRKLSIVKTVKDKRGKCHHYLVEMLAATPKPQVPEVKPLSQQETIKINPDTMTDTEKVEYIIKHHKEKTNRELAKDLKETMRNVSSIIHQCIKRGLLTSKPKGPPNRKEIDWSLLTKKYKK